MLVIWPFRTYVLRCTKLGVEDGQHVRKYEMTLVREAPRRNFCFHKPTRPLSLSLSRGFPTCQDCTLLSVPGNSARWARPKVSSSVVTCKRSAVQLLTNKPHRKCVKAKLTRAQNNEPLVGRSTFATSVLHCFLCHRSIYSSPGLTHASAEIAAVSRPFSPGDHELDGCDLIGPPG